MVDFPKSAPQITDTLPIPYRYFKVAFLSQGKGISNLVHCVFSTVVDDFTFTLKQIDWRSAPDLGGARANGQIRIRLEKSQWHPWTMNVCIV